MALLIIGWMICGAIHYGLQVAYCDYRWPMLDRQSDRIFAAVSGLGGPLALIPTLIMCEFGRHGWKV
jgi:hypothetical protein